MVMWFKAFLHRLKLSDFWGTREEFYEQLARSYENREGLRFFFDSEYKIASAAKTRNDSRAYALRVMRSKLARGNTTRFTDILGSVMPAGDRLLLSALDDAPDKALLMRTIAESIKEQRRMQQMVRGRVVPPLLILPGAFGFAYIMATQSLPIIQKVAPPGVWTPFNAAVRDFSNFIGLHGLTAVGVLLLAAAFFMYQIPRWTSRFRRRIEDMTPTMATVLFPVFPIALPLILYRDHQAGMLFNALSVLLQSGATLKDALQTVKRQSRPWLRQHITSILRRLEANPTGYQRAFEAGLMSSHMLARLSSQIRSNPNFDEVLIRLGQQGSAEIREVVGKQMGRLNGILLGMGGAMVVFMWVGQMSISQSMQEELSPTKQMSNRMQGKG